MECINYWRKVCSLPTFPLTIYATSKINCHKKVSNRVLMYAMYIRYLFSIWIAGNIFISIKRLEYWSYWHVPQIVNVQIYMKFKMIMHFKGPILVSAVMVCMCFTSILCCTRIKVLCEKSCDSTSSDAMMNVMNV